MKSPNYVKSIETIDEKVVKVIMHSRKSLLFDRDNVWVKKENYNFDGVYILNVLSSKCTMMMV